MKLRAVGPSVYRVAARFRTIRSTSCPTYEQDALELNLTRQGSNVGRANDISGKVRFDGTAVIRPRFQPPSVTKDAAVRPYALCRRNVSGLIRCRARGTVDLGWPDCWIAGG